MKQKLIEQEVDKSSVIAWAFNTLLSVFEKTSSQKICEDVKDPNNTINPHYLIDIFSKFHPTAVESHLEKLHMDHLPRCTIFWDISESDKIKPHHVFHYCYLMMGWAEISRRPDLCEPTLWLVDHYDSLGLLKLMLVQSQCLVVLQRSNYFLFSNTLIPQ